MEIIFNLVVWILLKISSATGLTYNEINIIVYFFIIPMIYIFMIDKMLKRHILKISFLVISILVLLIFDFHQFSDILFYASRNFLLSFGLIGLNYVVASVIICVVIPTIIFLVLLYLSFFKKK